MHKTIGVVFDFDDTLAPDSTSSFLEAHGLNVKRFWRSVDPLLDEGWDPVPAYLFRLLEASNAGAVPPITRHDLERHGRQLSSYPGVSRIFSRLRKHAHSVNPSVAVEFYLISSGIGEILRATPVAKQFKDIWACEFQYDETGAIVFPKNIVSFTDKTRFLFHILKGITGPASRSRPFDVNKKIPADQVRIPMKHMVFIGDGYTDVPCFALIKKSGGTAIGVYDRKQREKWGRAWGFTEEGRVSNLVPADFTSRSALSDSLMMAVESIARRIALENQTYQG
jgi:hypothetical protein